MILLDAFRVHALYQPTSTIMTSSSGDAVSYREAWNVSELLGAHLIERTDHGDLKPDDIIAVLGHDHPLLLSCCFACIKSGHAYQLYDDNAVDAAASRPLVLLASEQITATDPGIQTTQVLDAHRIRTYIVPGMTDDFSCGCGAEDCAHGPFLQECSPAEWLDDHDVLMVSDQQTDDPAPASMTVSQHDALLTEQLEAPVDKPEFSPPLNLANPLLAAVIALGDELIMG